MEAAELLQRVEIGYEDPCQLLDGVRWPLRLEQRGKRRCRGRGVDQARALACRRWA